MAMCNFTVGNDSHSLNNTADSDQPCQTLSVNQDLIATIIGVVVQIIIILAIALGNSIVLFLFIRTQALRITANVFVVSLAAADGLMSFALIPGVMITLDPLWITRNEYHCLMLWCAILFTGCTSALSLLAITVDRYIRIRWPLRYMNILTWSRVWTVIACTWVSTIICTVILPLSGVNKLDQETFNCFDFTSVFHPSYLVFVLFTFGMTPFFIMIILYGQIFSTVRKKIMKTRSFRPATGGSLRPLFVESRNLRAELKSVQTLIVILGFTGLAWIPFTVVIMMELATSYKASFTLRGILSWLTYLNSGVNPLIYSLRSSAFRTAWRRTWRSYHVKQRDTTGDSPTIGVSEKTATGTSTSTRKTILRRQSNKVGPDMFTISSYVRS